MLPFGERGMAEKQFPNFHVFLAENEKLGQISQTYSTKKSLLTPSHKPQRHLHSGGEWRPAPFPL